MPPFDLFRFRLKPASACAVGALLFALTLGLRLALVPYLAGYPFLTFFPAVVIAAVLCGPRVAGAVIAASVVSAWLFFIRVEGPMLPIGSTVFALAFFALVTGLEVALIEALARYSNRLVEERARADRLVQNERVMFQELQHRVANNMQLLSSMLALQSRRVHDEDARAALEDTTRRIDMMARIHRRLYDPALAQRDYGSLVEAMCRDLLKATGARNVVCRVDMAPVSIPLDRLTSLSLIITELMTNAIKHAFAGGRAGTISIVLRPLGEKTYRLEVRDDGPGLPEGFDPLKSASLGVRIMQSMAMKLGGQISLATEGGVVARLEFSA